MIMRKAYTRKNIHVSRGCIKAQSQSGKKRTDINVAKLKKLATIHKKMRKKFGTPSCKYIREGYTATRKGRKINVAPGCLKKKKGKQIFVLEKGTLTQYGYHANLPIKDRHFALLKALRHIKPLSVYRKLNALYILNKNKPLGILYRRDAEWVKTTHEYMTR